MIDRLAYLLAILFLIGCAEPDMTSPISDDRFDIHSFIETEIEKIADQDLVVEKTIMQNGKEEQSMGQTAEWIDLLRFFSKNDFNKPAYSGLYKMDSIHLSGMKVVLYTAQEEDMSPKQVSLNYSGSQISEIHYTESEKNFLFETQETKSLFVGQSIVIERVQNIRLLKPNKTRISASIKNQEN